MTQPGEADPGIYPKMRDHALHLSLAHHEPNTLQAIVMDWHVGSGTATVLAAIDGTASIYLSSGGGFIGGSQSSQVIRNAALQAMNIAERMRKDATATTDISLPPPGEVFFYFVSGVSPQRAIAREDSLRSGSSPFTDLGGAMQQIVTQYRLWSAQHSKIQ